MNWLTGTGCFQQRYGSICYRWRVQKMSGHKYRLLYMSVMDHSSFFERVSEMVPRWWKARRQAIHRLDFLFLLYQACPSKPWAAWGQKNKRTFVEKSPNNGVTPRSSRWITTHKNAILTSFEADGTQQIIVNMRIFKICHESSNGSWRTSIIT